MDERWLTVLGGESGVAFLLDRELRIQYTNPAWDRFAQENRAPELAGDALLGRNVMDFTAAVLQDYYRQIYEKIWETDLPFSFDYECSSPDEHRTFRMNLLPVASLDGIVVLNVVQHTRTVALEKKQRDLAVYCTENGTVVSCANCRRVRRPEHLETWDWLPELVANLPGNVSHGLCAACALYYDEQLWRLKSGDAFKERWRRNA